MIRLIEHYSFPSVFCLTPTILYKHCYDKVIFRLHWCLCGKYGLEILPPNIAAVERIKKKKYKKMPHQWDGSWWLWYHGQRNWRAYTDLQIEVAGMFMPLLVQLPLGCWGLYHQTLRSTLRKSEWNLVLQHFRSLQCLALKCCLRLYDLENIHNARSPEENKKPCWSHEDNNNNEGMKNNKR